MASNTPTNKKPDIANLLFADLFELELELEDFARSQLMAGNRFTGNKLKELAMKVKLKRMKRQGELL